MQRINLFIIAIIVVALAACSKASPNLVLKSISLKQGDSVTVVLGTPVQLTPVFTPTAFDAIPVEWSSTNASIVTVSPTGYVSASGVGTAWVKIKDKNSATTGKIKFIVK